MNPAELAGQFGPGRPSGALADPGRETRRPGASVRHAGRSTPISLVGVSCLLAKA